MSTSISEFHSGERSMHQLLKVTHRENPTLQGLPQRYGVRVMRSPLMALGTLDKKGRPWTSIWGGQRGFARPIAPSVLGVNSVVDRRSDPVFAALWDGKEGIVQPDKMMAALSIDLETRDRVKLAGRMLAGATGDGGQVQMAMAVTESLGNCPKYLNKKDVVPHKPRPELVEGLPLKGEAIELLERADIFFVSSTGGTTMDTNHRGGPPGFVRVLRNDEGAVELVYPEYSGNRLYQTLGNLKANPLVGIAVPDFETADVLHLTGSASVLVGEEALSVMARTSLAVKITVTDAKFIKSGLPFRGTAIDYSPYNPPVRRLLSEAPSSVSVHPPESSDISATLVKKEEITPTISRLTFRLSSRRGKLARWHAGQHLTLNFEPEVGSGYVHMCDEDPQSLNDDYVRTFTISSPPPLTEPGREVDVQITARRKGSVTTFLWRHNMRVPFEVPVLGVAGEEAFRIKSGGVSGGQVFIAAGVGITPLLAQARGVISPSTELRLLWSLRSEDLGLAVDSFRNNQGLADITKLFITAQRESDVSLVEEVKALGVDPVMRRLEESDVKRFKGSGGKFYLCTGVEMRKALEGWLEGEEVVWEDFGY